MVRHGPTPAVVMATGFTPLVIAAGVIVARLNLRLRIQKRKLLVSDIIMVLTLLVGLTSIWFLIRFNTLGALDPNVTTTMESFRGDPENIPKIFKTFWLANIPLCTTLYLSKAALLSMYLQIFPEFMRKRRIFLWAVITYVAMAYVTTILLIFCICIPFETNWDMDPQSTCPTSRTKLAFEINWSLHFFGDLVIFALPWLIVPTLNVRRSLKIGIYFTFLLGLIDILFTLLRFITIEKADIRDSTPLGLVFMWSALDSHIGIIVACLPSLRPYFGNKDQGYGAKSNSDVKSMPSHAGIAAHQKREQEA
ncbi:hypothetical protein BGZ61DRAFT_534715 [Ilyonectria robusta]|uniref:uncharacterized protein n=1 Tax=Ilyonectria robusta TaxID=1079257 RepID=UPI001E8E6C75|nr:uncharacterized protein BGZ61DRAFT_534715 [Ilyonectria robusta]KAH8684032.1 hypothetical protein BGZ61DRAFT_534715 [Ilyonectria robusta]